MTTITAQSIISRAQTILQDVGAVRWSVAEMLGWINDGQREIVSMRADANSLLANYTCVAGSKQVLTFPNAMRLIDVLRNMGTSGTTPGVAVRQVPRVIMDAQSPYWHAETQSPVIKHFMYDARLPRTFYTYPPAAPGAQLEVLYSGTPTDVSATGDLIGLDDVYAGPLLDYVLYRTYAKDTEFAGNGQRAMAARAAFENSIGLNSQSVQANTPISTGKE